MNVNIPVLKVKIRKEFLYNQEQGHGEYVSAYVFAATSLAGRAVLFHAFIPDTGAVYSWLPVHALTNFDMPGLTRTLPLDFLQIWDCFSYEMSVIQFDFLQNLRCRVYLKDKTWAEGTYLFTFDWTAGNPATTDTGFAEDPEQHKLGHFIELDCGHYAIQPNNRVLFLEQALAPNALKSRPDYKVNTYEWICEKSSKWATEDSDRYFYDYNEVKLPDLPRPGNNIVVDEDSSYADLVIGYETSAHD